MKSRDFCYWLQGFFEINEAGLEHVSEDSTRHDQALEPKQVEMIKKHLRLVFKHEIDPSMGDQEALNSLHEDGGDNTIPPSFSPQDTVRC